MSGDKLIAIALNQTIGWKGQKKHLDSFGKRRYHDAVMIPCRVSRKNRLILDSNREEKVSTAQVTTLAPVKPGDLLELDGREFIALSVSEPATFAGAIHRRMVFI